MEYRVSPEPYIWKEEYNVNIEIIDKQHKKFLEIINELKIIVNKRNCKEEASKVFFQIAYLIDHYFIKEEIYLKDCKYPHFEQHKIDHNQFLDKIIQFQKDLENDKKDICLDLYNYLEFWFDEHILKFDKEAVEYLKKNGVN